MPLICQRGARASKDLLVLGLTLVLLLIDGCAAAIPFMIGPAIEFARNLLVTSNSNYGKKYSADVNTLVMGLSRPYVASPYPLRPQPGFANPSAFGGAGSGFIDPNNPQGFSQVGGFQGGTAPFGSAPGLSPMGYSPADAQYQQYGMMQQGMYGQNYGGYGGYNNFGGGYGGYQGGYGQVMPGGYPGTGVPYGGAAGMQGYQTQQGYPLAPAPAVPPGQGYGNPMDPNAMAAMQGGYPPNQYQANQYAMGQYQQQSQYQQPPQYQPPYQQQPGVVAPGGAADPTQGAMIMGQGGYQPSQYQVPAQPQVLQTPGSQQQSGMMPIGATPQMVPGGYNSGAAFGFRGVDGALPPAQPVVLDVALVRQESTSTGTRIVALQDGEVMRDGAGNPLAADRFKVVFRTNCACYVYVVSVDGSGWVQRVYPGPSGSGTNPVTADQEIAFPAGNQWLSLDQTKGIETYFFVASPGPRPDLEEVLERLGQHQRPTGAILAKVEEPPVIPAGFGIQSQGAQAMVATRDADAPAYVMPASYTAAAPGQDVRVTRWFRHE